MVRLAALREEASIFVYHSMLVRALRGPGDEGWHEERIDLLADRRSIPTVRTPIGGLAIMTPMDPSADYLRALRAALASPGLRGGSEAGS